MIECQIFAIGIALSMESYSLNIVHWGSDHADLVEQIVKKVKSWRLTVIRSADQRLPIAEEASVLVVDSDHQGQRIAKKYAAQLVLLPAGTRSPRPYNARVEYLQMPITGWQIAHALHRLGHSLAVQTELDRLHRSVQQQNQEMTELNKIGIALSAERDADVLLEMILNKAREITTADAGSLYLIEKNNNIKTTENDYWADKQLRFKLAHNDSINSSYREFVMPVKKSSMAGYTAITGKPLNIPDAYNLPRNSQIQHNKSFDEKMGYRTQSVLCLPMKSHRGEMIGVLQLINRKTSAAAKLADPSGFQRHVLPFDQRSVEMASSLASQAAVSIENMKLYEEIKGLFEGFIVASVHAIEQRDPTTFGHSQRVAELSLGLAQKIDQISVGRFRDVHFSRDDLQQIKYAGLLHDFGKIGVRESVLVKAKKLYPEQIDMIKYRFQFIRQALELNTARKKMQMLLKKSPEQVAKEFSRLDRFLQEKMMEVDNDLRFILETNEPRLLDSEGFERLSELRNLTYRDNGSVNPYLTEQEFKFLSIRRGSLGEEERLEIESHVTHTFNFLKRIPWSSNLKNVPEIAHAHHEKLDGTGYPRGLKDEQIPLPSKIMAIADIYDALTAWDRPYKKAVEESRALEILGYEVKDGKLDADLLDVFVQAEVYKQVARPEKA